jgi:hypothetical protein
MLLFLLHQRSFFSPSAFFADGANLLLSLDLLTLGLLTLDLLTLGLLTLGLVSVGDVSVSPSIIVLCIACSFSVLSSRAVISLTAAGKTLGRRGSNFSIFSYRFLRSWFIGRWFSPSSIFTAVHSCSSARTEPTGFWSSNQGRSYLKRAFSRRLCFKCPCFRHPCFRHPCFRLHGLFSWPTHFYWPCSGLHSPLR